MSEVRKSRNGTFEAIEVDGGKIITRNDIEVCTVTNDGYVLFSKNYLIADYLHELASFISELRGEKGEVDEARKLLSEACELIQDLMKRLETLVNQSK